MNRAVYAPTAPPGYATVGSELTETDNEPPFRVFKFLIPKTFFSAGLSLFQGERTLPPLPLAAPLRSNFLLYRVVESIVALPHWSVSGGQEKIVC